MSAPAPLHIPTPDQYRDAYRAIRLRPHIPNPSARAAIARAAFIAQAEAARADAVRNHHDTPTTQANHRATLAAAISRRNA